MRTFPFTHVRFPVQGNCIFGKIQFIYVVLQEYNPTNLSLGFCSTSKSKSKASKSHYKNPWKTWRCIYALMNDFLESTRTFLYFRKQPSLYTDSSLVALLFELKMNVIFTGTCYRGYYPRIFCYTYIT